MTYHMSREEILTEVDAFEYPAQIIDLLNRWLVRGDGVAIYANQDLGHPDIGHIQMVSYGSPDAQIERDEPPEQMPDIGGRINWRYRLKGVYRGEVLAPIVH